MSFYSIIDDSDLEIQDRLNKRDKILAIGIKPLDDAFRGIFPDDLILIGAPSGCGKTQLCCNIALANMTNGKKVHYIALEASEFEIARRLKYKLVMDFYYSDNERKKIPNMNFTDWALGNYLDQMMQYESLASDFFKSSYKDLFLYSKTDRFGLEELIRAVCAESQEANLILIDHVHYFDFDDDNENRALKRIAKTVRDLALEEQKPIILIAHLRKRDRGSKELCAGMEEFHGSSDLFKIATKVITLSPGPPTESGGYVTYFRIPKNRIDGGVSRFLIKAIFNPKTGGYADGYQLGKLGKEEFEPIERSTYPDWAYVTGVGSGSNEIFARRQKPYNDD